MRVLVGAPLRALPLLRPSLPRAAVRLMRQPVTLRPRVPLRPLSLVPLAAGTLRLASVAVKETEAAKTLEKDGDATRRRRAADRLRSRVATLTHTLHVLEGNAEEGGEGQMRKPHARRGETATRRSRRENARAERERERARAIE